MNLIDIFSRSCDIVMSATRLCVFGTFCQPRRNPWSTPQRRLRKRDPLLKQELVGCVCYELGEIKIWQELVDRLHEISLAHISATARHATLSGLLVQDILIES